MLVLEVGGKKSKVRSKRLEVRSRKLGPSGASMETSTRKEKHMICNITSDILLT